MKFDSFATALFFLMLLLSACLMPAQPDTWLHLRAGEEMWRSHRVMLRDEFTHTVPGAYWPNHEWLTQVAFYAVYRLGGMPLLTAACAASVTIAWAIVAQLMPGPRLPRLALLAVGAVLSSPSWSLRPQVISLALLAATLWIVVRRRWLWVLPPLFLVWANLHGAVAQGGVVLAAGLGAALLVDRNSFGTIVAIAIACVLCTAATPLGFSLWQAIPQSLSQGRVYDILEWRRPGMALIDAPFWVMTLGIVALLCVKRSEILSSWMAASLSLATLIALALALQTRRNIPVFALCGVPLAATMLTWRKHDSERTRRTEHPRLNAFLLATVAGVSVLGVGVAWSQPLERLGWQPMQGEIRQALLNCPGALYNTYDAGGILIWFVRDKKVFMDSRPDPFPEELVRGHIELERSGDYRALFDRYNIGCALTVPGSPLSAALERDAWRQTGTSDTWTVLVRPRRPS